MGTHKSRGAAKKTKPSVLGRRLANVRVGSRRVKFAVHEDLLCSRSATFKKSIQKHRKPINESCAVCTRALNIEKDDVTYCHVCGNNIHNQCIDEWLHQNPRSGCPFCRSPWSHELTTTHITWTEPMIFDIYIKWLYKRELPAYDGGSEEVQDHFLVLVKSWVTGASLQDPEFQNAVLNQIVDVSNKLLVLPSYEPLEYLFNGRWNLHKNGADVLRLQEFLLQFYALEAVDSADALWYLEENYQWAKVFTHRLLRTLMQNRKKSTTETLKNIISKYTIEEHTD